MHDNFNDDEKEKVRKDYKRKKEKLSNFEKIWQQKKK